MNFSRNNSMADDNQSLNSSISSLIHEIYKEIHNGEIKTFRKVEDDDKLREIKRYIVELKESKINGREAHENEVMQFINEKLNEFKVEIVKSIEKSTKENPSKFLDRVETNKVETPIENFKKTERQPTLRDGVPKPNVNFQWPPVKVGVNREEIKREVSIESPSTPKVKDFPKNSPNIKSKISFFNQISKTTPDVSDQSKAGIESVSTDFQEAVIENPSSQFHSIVKSMKRELAKVSSFTEEDFINKKQDGLMENLVQCKETLLDFQTNNYNYSDLVDIQLSNIEKAIGDLDTAVKNLNSAAENMDSYTFE